MLTGQKTDTMMKNMARAPHREGNGAWQLITFEFHGVILRPGASGRLSNSLEGVYVEVILVH